ncbi:unnamed protein product [Prorocentrum cordatum]|uniref:Guanylate-binding protein N-terminal domain-containing protein n=1 Tax=Prorocentrum cordatum TaxID=2364126 RepID=A0ABN9R035_9DINO|nr:unnamed protein product [Polarella glacialis]
MSEQGPAPPAEPAAAAQDGPPTATLSIAGASRVAVSSKKWKQRALLNSQPLLKFEHHQDGSETSYLDEKGLSLIRGIKGPICPVVFIGDGRCGKSYLASRLVGTHEAFVSSDSCEAVTEGIDIAVAAQTGDTAGTILVMDCEGANNAMAEVRILVNVFAVLCCTQVVFVVNSMLSESALDTLATTLAARQMLKLDKDEGISTPTKLTVVVNMTTLKYEQGALEKTLSAHQTGPRAEVRATIKEMFPERHFAACTRQEMPNFEEQVQRYLQEVRSTATPLTVSGNPVTPEQLCLMLDVVRNEVCRNHSVSGHSMLRGVILDGCLTPLAKRLMAEASHQLPETLKDYQANLDRVDPRPETLRKFDAQSASVLHKDLVAEARAALEKDLGQRWDLLVHQNDLLGEQVASVDVEHREVLLETERVVLGGHSLLRGLVTSQEKVRSEARSVTHKKKGGGGIFGEWKQSGEVTTRLRDEGLKEGLEKLPRVAGHLKLRAPGIGSSILASGVKSCYMVLTDMHVMWWEGPTDKDVKPDGCYCLLEWPDMTLVQEGSHAAKFVLRSGADGGAFRFESESRNAAWWAEAFSRHAALAARARSKFPNVKLPAPPCLNDLRERNMNDIFRPVGAGSCTERCCRLLASLTSSGSADIPEQPPQATELTGRISGGARHPCRAPDARARARGRQLLRGARAASLLCSPRRSSPSRRARRRRSRRARGRAPPPAPDRSGPFSCGPPARVWAGPACAAGPRHGPRGPRLPALVLSAPGRPERRFSQESAGRQKRRRGRGGRW